MWAHSLRLKLLFQSLCFMDNICADLVFCLLTAEYPLIKLLSSLLSGNSLSGVFVLKRGTHDMIFNLLIMFLYL